MDRRFLDAKIPVGFVLLFVAVMVLGFGLFWRHYSSTVSKVSSELADARAQNMELSARLNQLTDSRATYDRQRRNYEQYSEYLEQELALSKSMYGRDTLFSSYSYGFQFAENAKDAPLQCKVDKESAVGHNTGDPSDLTVLCSWSNADPQGSKTMQLLANQIATDLNLITPISFTLSYLLGTPVPESKIYGKTRQGIPYYRSVESNARDTSYLYTFYSPKRVNKGWMDESGDYIQYTLKLSVFDATDEVALDSFAEKVMNQVTIIDTRR